VANPAALAEAGGGEDAGNGGGGWRQERTGEEGDAGAVRSMTAQILVVFSTSWTIA